MLQPTPCTQPPQIRPHKIKQLSLQLMTSLLFFLSFLCLPSSLPCFSFLWENVGLFLPCLLGLQPPGCHTCQLRSVVYSTRSAYCWFHYFPGSCDSPPVSPSRSARRRGNSLHHEPVPSAPSWETEMQRAGWEEERQGSSKPTHDVDRCHAITKCAQIHTLGGLCQLPQHCSSTSPALGVVSCYSWWAAG